MGVGGSGAQSVKALAAGGAAAATCAAAAARVSGNLAEVKNKMARRLRIEYQGCPRRDLSEEAAAGVERAGGPDGRSREAKRG